MICRVVLYSTATALSHLQIFYHLPRNSVCGCGRFLLPLLLPEKSLEVTQADPPLHGGGGGVGAGGTVDRQRRVVKVAGELQREKD